jgi:hypothetical protein
MRLTVLWSSRFFAACVISAWIAGTFFFAMSAQAQSITDGAIGGTVTDPSNAVVAGASVTVRNTATDATTSAQTDADGRYDVIHLQPGTYEVEAKQTGFATIKQTGIVVEVGRVTPVVLKLAVAGATETVTVNAESPVVNTEQQDFTTNFNQVELENLPINGRRWFNFALATPGASTDSSGYGDVSFRGINALLNNNTVDGGDNNQAFFSEEKGRTRIAYSTSQESIQEFQINTSTYSAEFGRAAGAVINAVTKSGSNEYHGALFYFNRDDTVGGAYTPFSTGPALVNGAYVQAPIKPLDIRQQFGGDVGGRIIRDKLFFYFNVDQQIRHFPAVSTPSNPTALFGALSSTEMSTLMTRLGPGTAANLTSAQINAGVAQVLGLYALDSGVVPRTGDQTLIFPKIDWKPNQTNTITLSYNMLRWDSPYGIQTNSVVARGLDSFGNDYVRDDTGVARWTSVIGARITNELRFQYGRDNEYESPNAELAGVPVASATGLSPDVEINGGGVTFEIGSPYYLPRNPYPDERRTQLSDTATYTFGRHLLKFGLDYNHVHDLLDALAEYHGDYDYTDRVDFMSDFIATQIPSVFAATRGRVCGTAAAPVACYNSYQQGFGPLGFGFATNEYGAFVQDEWRLQPRLTLNLGMRYEYEQLPSPQIPNLLFPATGHFPSDKTNFGPRLGFAWDLTGQGKTVVRGGYGIYYGRIINGTIFEAIAATGDSQAQITPTITPSTAGAPIYPNILSGAAGSAAKPNVVWLPSDLHNPMIQEYDMVFEHQVSLNTVISVSWLGAIGHFLPVGVDTNLPTPTTIAYNISGGPLSGDAITMPFFKGSRPNPNFGQMIMISSSISSLYNGGVLQFSRRLTSGLQFQASYTLAQSTDDGQVTTATPTASYPLDPYNIGLDKGPSPQDIRNRFTANLIWKPGYFDHSSGPAHWLLSGWTIAPVIIVQSGLPLNPTVTGSAPSGTGATSTGVIGSQASTARVPFEGRDSYRYPAIQDTDLRLSRGFLLHERMNLQVFAEVFNLTNHMNVTGAITEQYSTGGTAANPVLTYFPSFGEANAANNNTVAQPRQIQLGARFAF